MSVSTLPPTLNSHEQALVSYRSVSKLALLTLGMGMASALMLVHPLLAPVPLAAMVLAVLSLRGIRASNGQVIGRVPAIIGLCLAALFLGWGVSQRFSRELTLEARAREFADAWLTLVVRGDFQQAHQLKSGAHSRLRSVEGRQDFYQKNLDAQRDLKQLVTTSPLKEFIAAGTNVSYRFESSDGAQRDPVSDRLILRYSFDSNPAGGPQTMWIIVKRQIDEHGHADWIFERVVGEDDARL